jgi:hypothetical protein
MKLPLWSLVPPVLSLLAGCQMEMPLDAANAPGALGSGNPIPANLTVICDGFVQQSGSSWWVPSSNPGPVTVYETYDTTQSRYVPQYCEYINQMDRAERELIDAPAATWWWDYLRGQWPTHQAVRIVAGSSVQGDRRPVEHIVVISLWTVVFQRVTTAGKVTAERIYVLDGPASTTLMAWMDQSTAPPVALSAGQYAWIQNIGGVDQLGPGVKIPALSTEMDPNGPAHFVDMITKDTGANRHLPDGVP